MASNSFKLEVWFVCLLSLLVVVLAVDAQFGRCCREEDGDFKCCKELRLVDKILSRAGGIPSGSYLCLRHKYEVLREDRRCSCPSSWGHSGALHLHPIPVRLYQVFDAVGQSIVGYKPGTKWCNLCQQRADKELKCVKGFQPGLTRKVRSLEMLSNLIVGLPRGLRFVSLCNCFLHSGPWMEK